jgi:hypothetical protein
MPRDCPVCGLVNPDTAPACDCGYNFVDDAMSGESTWIVIYPSRLKGCALLLGAIMFVGLGIVFVCFRREMHISLAAILITSCVGVPFFGTCALYYFYRIIVHRPALVVGEQGIVDNATALAVGFLRWDEIEKVTPYSYMGQAMLGIFPKDLSGVLARQGWLKRHLLSMNQGLGCAPINIPQAMLPITVHALANRIEQHLGESLKHTAEQRAVDVTVNVKPPST